MSNGDEFKQARTLRRVDKTRKANTCDEIDKMDFVDYGGHGAFSVSMVFSRYSEIVFIGNEIKGEKAVCKLAGFILTRWVSFSSTPGIIIADNGPLFTGATVAHLGRYNSADLQTVIQGRQ